MINEQINIEVKTSGWDENQTATLTTFIHTTKLWTNKTTRPAIVICPGGGYHFCAPWEGETIALRFFADGYNTFVLNYSIAPARFPQAVCELAEAVRLVRSRAEEWAIDPDKIAVCGFSAGGHLAGSLGIFYDKPEVLDNLKCTEEECKPNGSILCYPVITSGEKAHRGSFNNLLGEDATADMLERVSLEKQVSETTPPAFIWHTYEDDAVPVENSIYMFSALREKGINAELHIFPHGGHGLCLGDGVNGPRNDEVDVWPSLASRWMSKL